MTHDNQAQPTGGWYAALAGAVLGTGLAVWWLAGDATPTGASMAAVTMQPAPWVPLAPAARSTPRPTATPPQPGRNVVVPVPGTVDGRYEIVSANNRELVLRDLTSATTQRIALGAKPPAGSAARTAAAAPTAQTVDYGDEPTAPVRPDKLPSPSKRISDEFEPEN
jgi:hypothetical protein